MCPMFVERVHEAYLLRLLVNIRSRNGVICLVYIAQLLKRIPTTRKNNTKLL